MHGIGVKEGYVWCCRSHDSLLQAPGGITKANIYIVCYTCVTVIQWERCDTDFCCRLSKIWLL